MKRILYIDPICLPGHLNYNQLQIDALGKYNYRVDYVFSKEYSQKLKLDSRLIALYIPSKFISYRNGIVYRLNMYRTLRYIKKNLDLNRYENVIISCYDEISLGIANFPKSYIIDHNNLSKLNNVIKKYFYNLISKKHIHVALNDHTYHYIKDILKYNVVKNAHGLVKPFYNDSNTNDRYIFAPSILSSDKEFIQNALCNEKFNKFLKKNRIRLILRGDYDISKCQMVSVIKGRMDFEDYKRHFVNAIGLLICYPKSFNYRVSGVLLEAISNQKKCIIRNLPDFKEYSFIFGEQAFFETLDELIDSITYICSTKDNLIISKQILDAMNPDYSFLENSRL